MSIASIIVIMSVLGGLFNLSLAQATEASPRQSLDNSQNTTQRIHFTPYRESWALLIGLNEYPHLDTTQQLHYSKNSVDSLKKLLVKKYGFKKEKITCLIDEAATKARIESAFAKLVDPNVVKNEDRVLVFYVGHGQKVTLPSGEDMGFLIPYDADIKLEDTKNPAPYLQYALPMSRLKELSATTPAKHVLFLIDACYSGLAVFPGSDIPQTSIPVYVSTDLKTLARTRTRQIITAGAKDEKVPESEKLCHTPFAYKLIEGLRSGSADLSGDSIITGEELAIYIRRTVPEIASQTPQFECFEGEGDFILYSCSGLEGTHTVVRPIIMPEPISTPTYSVTPLMLSALVPGLGQLLFSEDSWSRNVGGVGAEVISISYLLYANERYNSALRRYNVAREAYICKTDHVKRDSLVKAHNEMASWYKKLSVASGITCAIYLFNLWHRIAFNR